jgi:hypothetical protein
VGFEGSTQPHETEKYKGERYTAVFYTSSIQADDKARRALPPPPLPPHLSSHGSRGSMPPLSPPPSRGSGPAASGDTAATTTAATASAATTAAATANTAAAGSAAVSVSVSQSKLMQRFQAMKKKIQGRK